MMSHLLNERLAGLPLAEVRTQILHHIEAIQQEEEQSLMLAKELARSAFDLHASESQVYVDGGENIF